MCSRFQLLTQSAGARAILWDLKIRFPQLTVRHGEIFPTNRVPILTLDSHGQVRPDSGIWGFPKPGEREPSIHFPLDGLGEELSLSQALSGCRCVVPTNGFFGWNSERKKYIYTGERGDLLYLAGLCRNFEGQRHFLILTTQSPQGQGDGGKTLPVVVGATELRGWLESTAGALALLRQTPPKLCCEPVE